MTKHTTTQLKPYKDPILWIDIAIGEKTSSYINGGIVTVIKCRVRRVRIVYVLTEGLERGLDEEKVTRV